eukprot:7283393-Ditylum_brightwellii.AAC.1
MMKKLVQTHGYSALCFLRAASLMFQSFYIIPDPQVPVVSLIKSPATCFPAVSKRKGLKY